MVAATCPFPPSSVTVWWTTAFCTFCGYFGIHCMSFSSAAQSERARIRVGLIAAAPAVAGLAGGDGRGAEEARVAAGLSDSGALHRSAALTGQGRVHGRERDRDLVRDDLAGRARRCDSGRAGVREEGEKEEPEEKCEPLFAQTCSAQGGDPLSSSSPPLCASAHCVAQGMRLYMVERVGARDVTARCRSSFLRTGVQPNALSHSFQSALIGRATSPGA